MKLPSMSLAIASSIFVSSVSAYEINNHADMSEVAVFISAVNDTSKNGKLSRLGLKPFLLTAPDQRFPLDASLGPIPYCFGSERPEPFKVTTSTIPGQQPNSGSAQPNWTAAGGTQLTIAEFIRYGACYEDEEEPFQRSISHFYNPQDQGAGAPLGPSSLDWMLKRNPGADTKSGTNHYTWMDARDSFYFALTSNTATAAAAFNDNNRRRHWGATFQSLGHIIHHLQDMAAPQHVRADYHCNSVAECQSGIAGAVGLYRPSGYEKHFESAPQVRFVQALAQSATVPIMFGLPREFWNMNTDDALTSFNPNRYMGAQEGLAAYTSTNFTSAGKDFYAYKTALGTTEYRPATGLPFPKPSGQWNDVSLTEIYANTPGGVPDAIKNGLCGGDAVNCKMRFMGTEVSPLARTSTASIFSPELLNPAGTYVGPIGAAFQQSYFTYNDAARKLIPKAVEYSAGLINYFFRGEMEISLPEEGVYGVVDHAVEKTKGVDGFRLIKLKLKNTTPEINSVRGVIAQHMSNGEFRAVAKFRRNTCYTADLKGQIGTVGQGASPRVNEVAACRSAVDEIVVSAPSIDATALNAGVTKTLSFDFSANPVPIEATDLFIQVVFKGTLGEELGAVAVGTKDVSEPTFVSLLESSDYRLCSASYINGPPDDGSDPIGCARWNPDAGDSPIVQPEPSDPDGWRFRAWKTPEYGRWFGFHDAQNKNVVVARLPDGLPPGSYVRLGVIAAADNQPLILSYGGATNSNLPFTRWPAQGEFAVDDTEYWRSITYVKKTLVQADDDGVIDAQSLPKYWQARSVVLAAMTVWPAGGDSKALLPTLAIYRGEPLWSTPVSEFLSGVTSQAANVSVLNGDSAKLQLLFRTTSFTGADGQLASLLT
jgi:hypothetical protein